VPDERDLFPAWRAGMLGGSAEVNVIAVIEPADDAVLFGP
jgi:hypothetical protein